jgi:hypothetical protein
MKAPIKRKKKKNLIQINRKKIIKAPIIKKSLLIIPLQTPNQKPPSYRKEDKKEEKIKKGKSVLRNKRCHIVHRKWYISCFIVASSAASSLKLKAKVIEAPTCPVYMLFTTQPPL